MTLHLHSCCWSNKRYLQFFRVIFSSKVAENHLLLFYRIWGSKILNFLVILNGVLYRTKGGVGDNLIVSLWSRIGTVAGTRTRSRQWVENEIWAGEWCYQGFLCVLLGWYNAPAFLRNQCSTEAGECGKLILISVCLLVTSLVPRPAHYNFHWAPCPALLSPLPPSLGLIQPGSSDRRSNSLLNSRSPNPFPPCRCDLFSKFWAQLWFSYILVLGFYNALQI